MKTRLLSRGLHREKSPRSWYPCHISVKMNPWCSIYWLTQIRYLLWNPTKHKHASSRNNKTSQTDISEYFKQYMSWFFQLQCTYIPWGMKLSTEEEVCICCMLCVVTVIWDYLASKIHYIRMVTIDMLVSYPVCFRFYSFLFFWKVWWLFCVSKSFLGRCILLQQ